LSPDLGRVFNERNVKIPSVRKRSIAVATIEVVVAHTEECQRSKDAERQADFSLVWAGVLTPFVYPGDMVD